MEKADRELLIRMASSNPLLKELYEEHLKLEKEVENFGRYVPYSASAALRQKELKKAKLKGMDEIMSILSNYRVEDGTEARS